MIFGCSSIENKKTYKNSTIAIIISVRFNMTSFTVAFSGSSSILQADFFPEIIFDSNSKYCCGLLDFTSYNSIPNISDKKGNDKFKFKSTMTDSKTKKQTVIEKTIALPTGAYEVEDILKYLKQQLAANKINLTYEISVATSKVRIVFDAPVEWIDGSVLNVIGFQQKKDSDNKPSHIFANKTDYWSDNIIKITDIDIIRIECDIVSGSYINGTQCHTIHQFSHCKSAPGYKFIEIPQHIIYLPIEKKQLQTIQIKIIDQNNNLIDFRGEQISCRIHIKKIENENKLIWL